MLKFLLKNIKMLIKRPFTFLCFLVFMSVENKTRGFSRVTVLEHAGLTFYTIAIGRPTIVSAVFVFSRKSKAALFCVGVITSTHVSSNAASILLNG